jgi:hypothetical protein
VRFCFDSAGIVTKINAAAASARNNANLVWYNRKWVKDPIAGDVFTLWFNNPRGEHHTGFFHQKLNSSIFISVEGNTKQDGNIREGDGVYKKYRSFNATYSISRWTKVTSMNTKIIKLQFQTFKQIA